MKLFVFGLGFTGAALAPRLLARGGSVCATVRSPEALAAAEALGVRGVDAADGALVRQAAEAADAILIAAPPGDAGCPGFERLRAARIAGKWVGYLSTTGVYGDHGGGWVFEETPPAPLSREARLRAEAERRWLEAGASLFRLPGIYGPGRSTFDRLRAGTARRMVRPGQLFSRIHVDDLAEGLIASMARPKAGRIYNLCDDEPAPAAEVTAHAAELLGIEPPPEEPLDLEALSPAALRFWAESKRVSNARAKAELGWRPAYPTYREGLAAVLRAGG